MDPISLVVSNPPHGDPDAGLAAPALGLSAAEMRLKANYPIPQIWLADREKSRVDEAVETLRAAGMNVLAVNGERLRDVPDPEPVTRFEFGETTLRVTTSEVDTELPYRVPITAVFCQPHADAGEERRSGFGSLPDGLAQRRSGVFMARDSLVGFGGAGVGSIAGLSEAEGSAPPAAFLDIYWRSAERPRRMSVVENVVDFSGLKTLQAARATDNMVMFVAECEDRFLQGRIDRRLLNMHLRPQPLVGAALVDEDDDEGHHYTPTVLSQILGSISSGLKDIGQFELASRLAYLTMS